MILATLIPITQNVSADQFSVTGSGYPQVDPVTKQQLLKSEIINPDEYIADIWEGLAAANEAVAETTAAIETSVNTPSEIKMPEDMEVQKLYLNITQRQIEDNFLSFFLIQTPLA